MPSGFTLTPAQHVRRPAFGAAPHPLEKPQTHAAAPADGLWQGRVLFGNKGLTPSSFKVLQAWAQEKRAGMPLLHQAMYPLNGERVGIDQMTSITQAMSDDVRIQSFPLTRTEELALLQPLVMHERMLGDANEQVRFQTVFMTDRVASPEAQRYMVHRVLSHPDARLRSYLFFLQALQNQPDLDVLDMAQDMHPWVRYRVAHMLPELPDTEKRRQALQALLKDEVAYVRVTAATNAYLLPDETEGQRLIKEALDSTEAGTREYALAGIRHLKDPAEMAAQIRRTLKEDPAKAVQFLNMREALQEAGLWKEVVDALAGCSEPEAQMKAIPLLEDEAAREKLLWELTAHEKEHIGSWAAHELSDLPQEVKNGYFLKLAEDPEPRRRKAALYMLHGLKSKKLKNQVIRNLLRDPDETVRSQALLYAKGNLKPSRATDRLILDAMHSGNPELRAQAVWALPILTRPEQRAVELLKLLKDEDDTVRSTAIRGLASIEEPAVEEAYMRKFLTDGNQKVRNQAMMMDSWLSWPPEQRDRIIGNFMQDASAQIREYLPNVIGGVVSDKFERFVQSPYPRLMDESIRALDPESPLNWQDVMPAWILLLQSGADGTQLKQALAGYRETAAHAMKHREKFTQESQKPLTEEAMAYWLDLNTPDILTAITLLGADSVKAKFDEKSLKFHQYLQMAQAMANHPELGPRLYQTLHPGGRTAFPTWQVNRMLEIVFGLTLLGKPEDAVSVLNEIQRTRTIPLADFQNLFLRRLGEVAGLAPEDFEREDIRARLARWSDPYVFTVGSALNTLSEDSRKLLARILEADLKNRTGDFLTDESTPWGKGNQATREAFEANGLDYRQWLGYDKPVTVQLGKRTLEISLWNRDAARDLFLGSHSRTCLALDTRPEEMLDAFLNTMAQFALIRDKASGEPLGYIRMFWALPEKTDGQARPELYIDNVAYAYEKEDPEAARLLDAAADYARDFGRTVTHGRTPEIYLSRYIHTISPDRIAERPMRVLGGSRTGDYYLFAVDQFWRSKLDGTLTARVASGEKYGGATA